MKWQDIVKLSDEDLVAKGVAALGARRKMLKVFENVRIHCDANVSVYGFSPGFWYEQLYSQASAFYRIFPIRKLSFLILRFVICEQVEPAQSNENSFHISFCFSFSRHAALLFFFPVSFFFLQGAI
jgi:hypothetical protein